MYPQSHKSTHTQLTVILVLIVLYKHRYYMIFILIMNIITRKFTLHHNESLLYDKGMN